MIISSEAAGGFNYTEQNTPGKMKVTRKSDQKMFLLQRGHSQLAILPNPEISLFRTKVKFMVFIWYLIMMKIKYSSKTKISLKSEMIIFYSVVRSDTTSTNHIRGLWLWQLQWCLQISLQLSPHSLRDDPEHWYQRQHWWRQGQEWWGPRTEEYWQDPAPRILTTSAPGW